MPGRSCGKRVWCGQACLIGSVLYACDLHRRLLLLVVCAPCPIHAFFLNMFSTGVDNTVVHHQCSVLSSQVAF